MADNRPIGVFDSGLGGLTVMREMVKQLPNESIVYFGDTGRVPYGTRSRDIIKKYAGQDEKFLLQKDVKFIVAACGTVSSVAADTAKSLPVPFAGIISYSVNAAVNTTKNRKIGIIGTPATIKSRSHEKAIKSVMPDAQVIACDCPLFVPLVEEGWISPDDTVVYETAKRYLQPIKDFGVDTLIMGCTHYPVIKDVIAKIMGENVILINAGEATSVAVKKYLTDNGMLCSGNSEPKHSFFVSDRTDSFEKIAEMIMGEKIRYEDVEQVDIDKI